jgi:hypothetical protein
MVLLWVLVVRPLAISDHNWLVPMVLPIFEHMKRLAEPKSRYRVRGEIVEPFRNIDRLSGMVLDTLNELIRVEDNRRVIRSERFRCEGPFPRDAAALVVHGSVAVKLERDMRFGDVIPWRFPKSINFCTAYE